MRTVERKSDIERSVLSVLRDEIAIAVLKHSEVERHVARACRCLALHCRGVHIRRHDRRLRAEVAQHVLLIDGAEAGASKGDHSAANLRAKQRRYSGDDGRRWQVAQLQVNHAIAGAPGVCDEKQRVRAWLPVIDVAGPTLSGN